jgi:hypothetical protein
VDLAQSTVVRRVDQHLGDIHVLQPDRSVPFSSTRSVSETAQSSEVERAPSGRPVWVASYDYGGGRSIDLHAQSHAERSIGRMSCPCG